MVDVAMTFATTGTAPVLLSLPAWTPGAYEISNFAAGSRTSRRRGDGKPLTWDKLDYDTWRIRPGWREAVRVRFQLPADTLDNAMTWSKPDFLLFNGTNLFMYPEGRSAGLPRDGTVHTEPDWRVATGMAHGATPRTFTATELSRSRGHAVLRRPVRSRQRAGRRRWVRFATYPAGIDRGPVRQTRGISSRA